LGARLRSPPKWTIHNVPTLDSFQYLNQTIVLAPMLLNHSSALNTTTTNSILEEIIPGWFHRNDPVLPPLRTLDNIQSHAAFSLCSTSSNSSSTLSITLVLQTSLDRLYLVNETCSRWKDPILVVVYIEQNESIPNPVPFSTLLCPHVTLIPFSSKNNKVNKKQEEEHAMYPINQLRNVGLDHVQTSHVLVMDIDFIPSMDLDAALHSVLTQEETFHDNDMAWIIPAFEYPDESVTQLRTRKKKKNPPSILPQTIQQLYTCYFEEKKCRVFQQDMNWEGHSTTPSESWLQDQIHSNTNHSSTSFRYPIPCFQSPRYEPYLVLPWCSPTSSSSSTPSSPYYDERFHGYGKNKIQYIQHVRYLGYRFHVVPVGGFMIHYPHEISKAKDVWNRKEEFSLHEDMDVLYPRFLNELEQMYGEKKRKSRTPFCA